MKKGRERDVEKGYPRREFIAKLRRFADALEANRPFTIQIAGERIRVPAHAVVAVEHERGGEIQEIEFQVRWKSPR